MEVLAPTMDKGFTQEIITALTLITAMENLICLVMLVPVSIKITRIYTS